MENIINNLKNKLKNIYKEISINDTKIKYLQSKINEINLSNQELNMDKKATMDMINMYHKNNLYINNSQNSYINNPHNLYIDNLNSHKQFPEKSCIRNDNMKICTNMVLPNSVKSLDKNKTCFDKNANKEINIEMNIMNKLNENKQKWKPKLINDIGIVHFVSDKYVLTSVGDVLKIYNKSLQVIQTINIDNMRKILGQSYDKNNEIIFDYKIKDDILYVCFNVYENYEICKREITSFLLFDEKIDIYNANIDINIFENIIFYCDKYIYCIVGKDVYINKHSVIFEYYNDSNYNMIVDDKINIDCYISDRREMFILYNRFLFIRKEYSCIYDIYDFE